MIGHFGGSLLRFAGVAGFRTWRAAAAEVVQPRQLPDGLLDVVFPDRPEPSPFLLEIATYPERRVGEQVLRDALLVWLDRRVLPEVVTLVRRPKGNLRVTGRQAWTSPHGLTRARFIWRVVELWTVPAEDLLAANDIGLVPWVPLTQFNAPPEVVLRECRERIDRQAPKELHANLLAVTQVMANLRYNDPHLLTILGGTNVMIESPLIHEIIVEAEARGKQEMLEAVLKARFGRLPRKLFTALHGIQDLRSLTRSGTLAARCKDLEEFQRRLPEKR